MGKQLRLGFAMGGGVSLGAYSGAALTEAIKLAILRSDYESVVVDVFSGASAGAMSLLLMLRALAAPSKDPDDIHNAKEALRTLYGEEFTSIPASDPRYRQLLVAQMAQDLQEKAWVEKISLERLLGKYDDAPPLEDTVGLLSRHAVDSLAKELVGFDGELDLEARSLLGKRVVFVCTLTNLTATRNELPEAQSNESAGEEALSETDKADASRLALLDALTSDFHREARVFDLWMEKGAHPLRESSYLEYSPKRWYRFRNGEKIDEFYGDLRKPKAWARLASTAIACGAFPLAFEPVVLTRRDFELGNNWTAMRERLLACGAENPDRINMTYVDGGTLNNEPIREAYRVASLIDSMPGSGDFDRRIIFVDPRLGADSVSWNVPLHSLYGDTGTRAQSLNTFDRLKPHLANIASVFVNEATRNEADKIQAVNDRFLLRNKAREKFMLALLGATQSAGEIDPNADVDVNLLTGLMAECKVLLSANANDATFPPGQLNLDDELRRVIREQRDDFAHLLPRVREFTRDPGSSGHKPLWLRALVFVYLDLLLDVEGKREKNLPLGIAPLVTVTENDKDILEYEPLPGHELSGFAGFASRKSRQHQVKRARFDAAHQLHSAGLLYPPPPDDKSPPWSDADYEAFVREVNGKMRGLAKRLLEIADLGLFFKFAAWIGRAESKITKMLAIKVPSRTVELRITVPKGCVLKGVPRGRRTINRQAADINGEKVIVICLDLIKVARKRWRWEGQAVDAQGLHLDVHKGWLTRVTGRKAYCRIELPSVEKVGLLDNLAYPYYCIDITEVAAGSTVPASDWHLGELQPISLEETLFKERGSVAHPSPTHQEEREREEEAVT